MQKCSNTDGSYNCSCDEFFKPDPADWRNCLGEFDIRGNIFRGKNAPYEKSNILLHKMIEKRDVTVNF